MLYVDEFFNKIFLLAIGNKVSLTGNTAFVSTLYISLEQFPPTSLIASNTVEMEVLVNGSQYISSNILLELSSIILAEASKL